MFLVVTTQKHFVTGHGFLGHESLCSMNSINERKLELLGISELCGNMVQDLDVFSSNGVATLPQIGQSVFRRLR